MISIEELVAKDEQEVEELITSLMIHVGGRHQPPWDTEDRRVHCTAVKRLTKMIQEAPTEEERGRWQRCLDQVRLSERFGKEPT